MATFEEHCRDCERLLGTPCKLVHHWLDQFAFKLGALHRFKRHHDLGVAEASRLYGNLGRQAALIHILKDCGHIPTANAWKEQRVDSLGFDPKTSFNGYWDPQEFDRIAKKMCRLFEDTIEVRHEPLRSGEIEL